jgi:hypothetical protein
MRNIVSLLLLMLLTACVAPKPNYYAPTVNSWRGSHISTLTQRWGTPDIQRLMSNGHSLYLYKIESYRSTTQTYSPSIGVNDTRGNAPILTSSAPNTNMTWNRGGMSLSCAVLFETNKNNIIVNTTMQGNGCYGGKEFARKKANPAAPVKVDQ